MSDNSEVHGKLKNSNTYCDELIKTARALVEPGKGILAADESTGTIGKRLKDINVENTLENRCAYREALFSTPNIAQHISGVILFDETARNKNLRDLISKQNLLIGIKVDKGTRQLPLAAPGFLFTQGLDDLTERCKEYYEMGCRFAKWRSVLKIVDYDICAQSIKETAYTLARYAATCQANGLVPIVEPEILMDGPHCVGVCRLKTEKVLSAVFRELAKQNVLLEGMILKCNMVLPGSDFEGEKDFNKNAELTVKALKRTLPTSVPGVTFLSGGQSEEEASLNLNAINQIKNLPWNLGFSFGRALQKSALTAWAGKKENTKPMQDSLMARAKANGEATFGNYKGGAPGSKESLFKRGYVY